MTKPPTDAEGQNANQVCTAVCIPCTVQYMTETEQLEQAATKLQEARDGVDAALAHAREVALRALDAGLTEVAVARTLRVSRTTIRTWTGK